MRLNTGAGDGLAQGTGIGCGILNTTLAVSAPSVTLLVSARSWSKADFLTVSHTEDNHTPLKTLNTSAILCVISSD